MEYARQTLAGWDAPSKKQLFRRYPTRRSLVTGFPTVSTSWIKIMVTRTRGVNRVLASQSSSQGMGFLVEQGAPKTEISTNTIDIPRAANADKYTTVTSEGTGTRYVVMISSIG